MLHSPFGYEKKKNKDKELEKLHGERVFLRHPHLNDFEQWAELRALSQSFLKPWEPKWPPNALSLTHFRSLIQFYDEGRTRHTYRMFFIFSTDTNTLIGGISLGNIHKGVVQSGQIGYWCGVNFSGQGYMQEALKLLIDFALFELRLNRLEAAVIPTNEKSIKLLEKCGFQKEGLLRSYVKINDKWHDHFLYSLLKNDRT